MNKRVISAVIAVAYIGGIVAANYVTTQYGLVPMGFGLTATAGTFFAGLALALRDVGQDFIGRLGVAGLILTGCVISYFVAAPFIAIASASAFLVSEFLDMAAYSPIRRRTSAGTRTWILAVAISGLLGAIADSLVFLSIAGFPVTPVAILGQLVGKSWAIGLVVLGGYVLRRQYRQAVGEVGMNALPVGS